MTRKRPETVSFRHGDYIVTITHYSNGSTQVEYRLCPRTIREVTGG